MMPALGERGRLGPGMFTRGWLWTEVTTVFKGPLLFTFTGIMQSTLSNVEVIWP